MWGSEGLILDSPQGLEREVVLLWPIGICSSWFSGKDGGSSNDAEDLVAGRITEFLVRPLLRYFLYGVSWWPRPGLVVSWTPSTNASSEVVKIVVVVCGSRLSRRFVCPGRPLKQSKRAYYVSFLSIHNEPIMLRCSRWMIKRYEPIMLLYRHWIWQKALFI